MCKIIVFLILMQLGCGAVDNPPKGNMASQPPIFHEQRLIWDLQIGCYVDLGFITPEESSYLAMPFMKVLDEIDCGGRKVRGCNPKQGVVEIMSVHALEGNYLDSITHKMAVRKQKRILTHENTHDILRDLIGNPDAEHLYLDWWHNCQTPEQIKLK